MLMTIQLYCTEAPNAEFSSNGAYVTAVGDMIVSVVAANGTSYDAFTLNGTIFATGNVRYFKSLLTHKRPCCQESRCLEI